MSYKRTHGKHASKTNLHGESLESRHLLAGDLAAGDANEDYFVDEADLVLAFQAAKFDNGEPANRAEGDWTGDELFDTVDLIRLFQEGNYRHGAYDPEAGEPINQLEPISTEGDADTIIHYDSNSGNLTIGVNTGFMSAIHIRSIAGRFNSVSQQGIFDVSTATDLFSLSPLGSNLAVYEGILPAGLNSQEVGQDLLVEGARISGGPLGSVQMGGAEQLPELHPDSVPVGSIRKPPVPENGSVRVPDGGGSPPPREITQQDGEARAGDANRDFYFDPADLIHAGKAGLYETGPGAAWESGDWNGDGEYNSSDLVVAFQGGIYTGGAYDVKADVPMHSREPFSETGDADVIVHYDSATGDLTIESLAGRFDSLHIVSQSGGLTLMGQPSIFEVSTPESLFLFSPGGFEVVRYESVLPTDLIEQTLRADLRVDGSMFGGGSLGNVQLNVLSPQQAFLQADCRRTLQDGHLVGDANLDGIFNSQDLVAVFQAGKYESGRAASWSEGDWNCDGVFNSSDFVDAFKAGGHQAEAIKLTHDDIVDSTSPRSSDEAEEFRFFGAESHDVSSRRIELVAPFTASERTKPTRGSDPIRSPTNVDTVMLEFESIEEATSN